MSTPHNISTLPNIQHKRFGELVKLPNLSKPTSNDTTFFGKYININPIESPKNVHPFVVDVEGKQVPASIAYVKGCLLVEKLSKLKRGVAYLCMVGLTRRTNYQGFCHTREGRGRELLLSRLFQEPDRTLWALYWVCRRLCVKDFRCKNLADCCPTCFPDWCKTGMRTTTESRKRATAQIVPVSIPGCFCLYANVATGPSCEILIRFDATKYSTQNITPDYRVGTSAFFCLDRPDVMKMLYSNRFLESLKRNDHQVVVLALRLFGIPDKSVISDLEKLVDTLYKLSAGQTTQIPQHKIESLIVK
jgi:hypothetical protein